MNKCVLETKQRTNVLLFACLLSLLRLQAVLALFFFSVVHFTFDHQRAPELTVNYQSPSVPVGVTVVHKSDSFCRQSAQGALHTSIA